MLVALNFLEGRGINTFQVALLALLLLFIID